MKILIPLGCLVLCSLFAFSSNPKSSSSLTHTDSFSLVAGKSIFSSNCAGCHGSKGEGGYGPNLCDEYWLHGHHYHNVVHVIKHGVTAKGMSAFKHSLNHSQVRDVAHYILLTLKGTKPANAKGPQGKKG